MLVYIFPIFMTALATQVLTYCVNSLDKFVILSQVSYFNLSLIAR